MQVTRRRGSAGFMVAVSAMLLATAAWSQQPLPTDPRDPRLNQGPKSQAVGEQVMVSTQLPIVTQGALEVLRNGGNAVDAMITAIFLQHVNDYMQVSHFGSMSGIYYEAATGEYHFISAVGQLPVDRCEDRSANQVVIGGVIRGMGELADRWGTMDWADYIQPAIESAEEGVMVTSYMYGIKAGMIDSEVAGSTYGIHGSGLSREIREFFLADGHLTPVGERWKMPQLADHLKRLAEEGPDYMYTGEWGQKFVREANRRGHCISDQDMADFEVYWQEPVKSSFRGHEIIGSPPPDTGGAEMSYNLSILENFDLAAKGHYTESAETLEIMARTFGRVATETRWAAQDPLAFRTPLDLWTDPEYGRMGARFVRGTMRQDGVSLAAGADHRAPAPLQASASASVPAHEETDGMGSNHNVIVDADGNWFVLLHTGHGGAPGVMIDGVRAGGSRLSHLSYATGPGRRLVTWISSGMVARDGVPWMALGTPGSPPQPMTQVLLNVLEFGMEPADAADAPRFFAFRDDYRELEMESRLSDEMRRSIAEAGLRIKDLGDYTWRTGSMQIVWRDPETGRLHGATDARRLGEADGY